MILLPKSTSLETIHQEGQEKIKDYYPQRMEAIIELIQKANFATVQKRGHRELKEKPYVNSGDLNAISGNYKEYVNVLFFLGLIVIDDDYSHVGINPDSDPFPKAYEFSAIFREKLFYQKTKGIDRKDYFNKYKYVLNNNYISKYLNVEGLNKLNIFYAFLSFDVDSIINDINNVFDKGVRGAITTRSGKELKSVFKKYNSFVFWTYSLGKRDFWFSRSLTNHRLYGPLTNYPKKLRKHFTLAGKKIVSIDLSNAQPFFSLLLFKKDFWLGEDCSNPLPINIETIGMKDHFNDAIYNYIHENNFPSLKSYSDLVLKNKLYDSLIGPNTPDYDKARTKAKKSLYGIIFSEAESKYEIKAESNRGRFIASFPHVYEFFNFIKSDVNQNAPIILNTTTNTVQKAHSLLPIILQRIEAFIFIDVIVPYILENHPNIPMIPIHDCLATTEEHSKTVERIIKEQIINYTGNVPKLKPEVW